MEVDTRYLRGEQQYARDFPELYERLGVYEAEVGLHKFSFMRTLKKEINLYTMRLLDTGFQEEVKKNKQNLDRVGSENTLTYSVFSVTTASSMTVAQMASTKFRNFKTRVQAMRRPTQT